MQNDLEHRLSVFVREEVISWYHSTQNVPGEGDIRSYTVRNTDAIVKQARLLACQMEREKVRAAFSSSLS